MVSMESPKKALERLKAGNRSFCENTGFYGDITSARREDTAKNGQKPYAVILTCSDSRLAPEHIFSAGLGDIFVIRTAGNVVGDFELGSIEYGVLHLGAALVVVLGHNSCGAVAAALGGHAEGHIKHIVDEIKTAIGDKTDSEDAENLNIENSRKRILESSEISKLVREEKVSVVGAKYDIAAGEVRFF